MEVGGAAPPPASAPTAPAAAPAAVPAAAAPPQAAAVAGGISEETPSGSQGNKWSKSTIAAEQARRGRKGLPALNNAEMSALLGEPVEASAPPAAAAAPAPAAAAAAAKAVRAPSAQKSPSGSRKERSGASPQSLPNKRVVDARAARTDRCGSCRVAGRTCRSACSSGCASCGGSCADRLPGSSACRGRLRLQQPSVVAKVRIPT